MTLPRAILAPLALVLFALAPIADTAKAMSVTPIQVEMTSAGSSGRAQVTVNNDANEPLPVEIVLQKLSLDEKGNRKLSKAGEDFLIFPPQALIAPGSSQVFRLQWVGEPMMPASESYLMSVNQVPVKLPKGKSAVQIVMSFGVIINVAPPQGKPTLAVVGTGVEKDKRTGKRYPTLTVQNSSNVHALLPQSTLKLSGGGWSKSMSSTELAEKIGVGLVQPGKKRRFVVPVELPANVASVTAGLDFKPKR
ncbi:MAG: molecular chaperone [Hyphomicrobiaceae bacterium]|nr:molecular chaperone [Hyphomicrobiaceae bacterium]